MERVIIRSSCSDASITFCERDGDDFTVLVSDRAFNVRRTVYGYLQYPELVRLFKRMADAWDGWPGAMMWSSLENEMELVATHDRLGHITLGLKLRHPGIAEPWDMQAHVTVDAGQLDRIAQEMDLFFSGVPSSSLMQDLS